MACSQWDMLSGVIGRPLIVGSDVYITSESGGEFYSPSPVIWPGNTLVQFQTQPVPSALAPAPGPGACLGVAIPADELGHPSHPLEDGVAVLRLE
jgi:hypothetical protein